MTIPNDEASIAAAPKPCTARNASAAIANTTGCCFGRKKIAPNAALAAADVMMPSKSSPLAPKHLQIEGQGLRIGMWLYLRH